MHQSVELEVLVHGQPVNVVGVRRVSSELQRLRALVRALVHAESLLRGLAVVGVQEQEHPRQQPASKRLRQVGVGGVVPEQLHVQELVAIKLQKTSDHAF